jgi:hypothetical protein
VFPGLLNEDIPIEECWRKNACIVLTPGNSTPKQHWAIRTSIPESLMEHAPEDNTCFLLADSHELRHLQQIQFESKEHRFITTYYRELDADLAARSTLQQAAIGQETNKASLHSRYLEMLVSDDSAYWFAATLEAIEAKREAKDYFSTHRAVMEIRLRLAMQYEGEDLKDISSQQLQNAIGVWNNHPGIKISDGLQPDKIDKLDNKYSQWKNSLLSKNPASLYTGLRQLVERGVFTDPFSQQIAVKILEAASYFNPDLIYADHEPNRNRMKARLESSRTNSL